ncbi:hypothetical protein CKM354_000598700 [Cercospora kikuchii]|uniref:Uncharacterized protein n=1 Tax=Cercospora kikuchii TaxID=84275 RepID=A0A9P3CH98_9PEZI|nr:uncharacterized protein CKM354_000598700 [Cercospora kikuchii]GIZ42728.1 hypothetical protein CKM354_000598700 [Cercospora kikuchii]
MVPRAATFLLALVGTSAAVGDPRPFHGPYRIPKAHERRADINKPPFPLGTGTTALTSSKAETLQETSTAVAGALESSHAATSTASDATPPTLSSTVAQSELVPTSSDKGTQARNSSSPFTQQSVLSQTSITAQVPTTSLLRETEARQTGSNGTGRISGSPNITTVGPTDAIVSSPRAAENSSWILTGNTTTSLSLPRIVNSSSSRLPLSNFSSRLFPSSRAIVPSGHGPSLGNLTAVHTFNPPRPTICSGATLNIKNASLDYWYAQTYTQVDSTFLIEFNENDTSTGWTLLPATGTLDITSAIANPECSSTTSFAADISQSGVEYYCSETATPAAKSTSVVEQTAYIQPNATTSNGELPDVVIAPTPAAITVANAAGTSTYHAGTSVVHFSRYEIVSKQSYRHWNGSQGCSESAQVYDLPEPASFEYQEETTVNESLAVGKLGRFNAALLRVLSSADVELPRNVALGDLEAEPTVVVVVEKVVAAAAAIPLGFVSPSPKLETPTATLPPGLSFEATTPTEPGSTFVPITAHVERSAESLDVPSKTTKKAATPQNTGGADVGSNTATGDGEETDDDNDSRPLISVPFVAHLENSAVTLAVPLDPTNTQNVVTAQFSGRVVTATRLPGASPIQGGDANVGRIVSIIQGAAQPTNALEVLNQAQATFSANGPASAIAAGLGLPPLPGDSDNLPLALPLDLGSQGSGLSNNELVRPLIIGTSVFSATRVGEGLVIEDQTVVAGGAPITVANHAISLSPGATAVAMGGNVVNVGSVSGMNGAANAPMLTLGDTVLAATRVAAGFIVAGQTLSAGGASVTVGGSAISLNEDATEIKIGGSTVNIASQGNVGAAANIPVIQVGADRFTANAATQFNIDGTILTPGGQVVAAGTTISLGTSATALIIDGTSQQLSPPVITPAPLLTIDGIVYRPNLGSTYDIDSTFLTPGGEVVVSGTTISLPTTGQSVIINGIARPIATGRPNEADFVTITAPPALFLNGRLVTPNAGTSYIIFGQTLSPGGFITLERPYGTEVISLNSAADQIVRTANGQSYTSYIGMVGAAPGGAPILTIDDETYSAIEYNVGSGATYLIDDQTLKPGGVITIERSNGKKTISLLPAGTAIVLGSNGITSTSVIDDAYGVRPTRAPVLTIGGETFTAINNGVTYSIDGQTLTPGEVETVTVKGHTYIVSLSPYATILEVVEVGANGTAITTIFETLFPATAAAATTTSTESINSASTTARASGSSSSPIEASSADDQSGALHPAPTTIAVFLLVISSLAMAIWL